MAFSLFKLDQNFFPTPWDLQSWQNLFSSEDRLLLLALSENIIIGFCLFNISKEDSFAHLLKILVHPNFRKKKIGNQLLSDALLKLTDLSCRELFLEVDEKNESAINLYKALGFLTIHRKKDFYGQNGHALIMTKS
jgi:ribosomal-protein-alanine N-acetyltransferase